MFSSPISRLRQVTRKKVVLGAERDELDAILISYLIIGRGPGKPATEGFDLSLVEVGIEVRHAW